MLHLVINLERSVLRWSSILKELSRFKITPIRVNAIDAKDLTDETINLYKVPIFSRMIADYQYKLSITEYACFLSHKKCWQRLVDSNEDYALILEDDVCLSDSAKEYILNENWLNKPFDLVQIFNVRKVQQVYCFKREIELSNVNSLIRQVKPTPVGALAYIISKNCAKKAILASKYISAPVDEFLFSPYCTFAKAHPSYKLKSSVVSTYDYESTIGHEPKKERDYNFIAKYHPIRIIRRVRHILSYKLLCKRVVVRYKE